MAPTEYKAAALTRFAPYMALRCCWLRPGARGGGLRPLSSGGGFPLASPPPLPPPPGARGEREASGLGGSRPRPSGPPLCAAAASVLSKILDYWGLTFRLRRGMLFS